MKTYISAISLLILLIVSSSCSKLDESEDSTAPDNTEQDSSGMPLSVEAGKQLIEDSGNSLLDKVKDMENTNSMQVYKAMIYFMDLSDPLDDAGYWLKSGHIQEIYGIQTAKALTNTETSGIDNVLKSMLLKEDDPETLQSEIDSLSGNYTWNSSINKWTYVKNSNDDIVFNFPSSKNGTVNNATYKITYDGTIINGNRFENDYQGDFPKKFTATLEKDNASVSEGVAEFKYDTDGSLLNFDFSYEIDGYKFIVSFENSANEEAKANFTFEDDTETFLNLETSASGNWSNSNVKDNTRYYVEYYNSNEGKWDKEEVSENDDYNYLEMDVDKIVVHGNIKFQLMNVELVGAIDVKNLYREIYNIENNWNWDEKEEEAYNEEVKIINDYINLSILESGTGNLLADCEAYLIKEDNSYYWNDQYINNYDYYLGLRFIFGDDSKIDAETYFNTDFDQMIDNMENYIEDIGNEYNN